MDFVGTLFGSVSAEEFVSDYWDKQPCLLRGEPERIETLLPGGLSRSRLLAIVDQAATLRGFDFDARVAPPAFQVEGFEANEVPTISLTPEATREVLTGGIDGLLTLWDLHELDPGLLHFYREMKHGLGLIGDCHTAVFCHPPSGRGIGRHFDHSAVFQLLVSGEKHWRVSRRPHELWPRSSAYARRDGKVEVASDGGWDSELVEDEPDLIDVVMTAGDVLYLPPGTWHETRSTPGGSLGVTFEFYPATFADVLGSVLKDEFETVASWRTAMPPQALSSSEKLTIDFLADRLDELRKFLATLGADGPELRRARRKLLAKRVTSTRASLDKQLTEDERLRHPLDAHLTWTEENDVLHVYYGSEEVCFDDPRFLPFARRLVSNREFRAGDTVAWSGSADDPYTFDEVRPMLEALLGRGLLVEIPSSG